MVMSSHHRLIFLNIFQPLMLRCQWSCNAKNDCVGLEQTNSEPMRREKARATVPNYCIAIRAHTYKSIDNYWYSVMTMSRSTA